MPSQRVSSRIVARTQNVNVLRMNLYSLSHYRVLSRCERKFRQLYSVVVCHPNSHCSPNIIALM